MNVNVLFSGFNHFRGGEIESNFVAARPWKQHALSSQQPIRRPQTGQTGSCPGSGKLEGNFHVLYLIVGPEMCVLIYNLREETIKRLRSNRNIND